MRRTRLEVKRSSAEVDSPTVVTEHRAPSSLCPSPLQVLLIAVVLGWWPVPILVHLSLPANASSGAAMAAGYMLMAGVPSVLVAVLIAALREVEAGAWISNSLSIILCGGSVPFVWFGGHLMIARFF